MLFYLVRIINTTFSRILDTTNLKTPPIGSEEYLQIISYSAHDRKLCQFNLYELLGERNTYTVLFFIVISQMTIPDIGETKYVRYSRS